MSISSSLTLPLSLSSLLGATTPLYFLLGTSTYTPMSYDVGSLLTTDTMPPASTISSSQVMSYYTVRIPASCPRVWRHPSSSSICSDNAIRHERSSSGP